MNEDLRAAKKTTSETGGANATDAEIGASAADGAGAADAAEKNPWAILENLTEDGNNDNSENETVETAKIEAENGDEYRTLEELQEMFDEPGFLYYGHGTGRSGDGDEVVEAIFREGLRTKDNSLYRTTMGLSAPTPELKAQYAEFGLDEPSVDGLTKQLNNWEHQNSQKIIIMRLPIEFVNHEGDREDRDGEMFGAFYAQKTLDNGKTVNYLEPKFIAGCFDAERQVVRMNANFERDFSAGTRRKLENGYAEATEKTAARLERMTGGEGFGI